MDLPHTPPGTKIRLIGRVQIRVGFLILRRSNFEVLQGSVDLLCREWALTRVGFLLQFGFHSESICSNFLRKRCNEYHVICHYLYPALSYAVRSKHLNSAKLCIHADSQDAKGTRRSHRTGPDAPPPFVAFGTTEASAMIDSHNNFLNNLWNRNRPKGLLFLLFPKVISIMSTLSYFPTRHALKHRRLCRFIGLHLLITALSTFAFISYSCARGGLGSFSNVCLPMVFVT
ncbi:unnamed protein product [Hydatigera taeniaeformis]|uniref:RecQ mediated genome instability protein 1 OB-fold domain-containing protein n=1 Tax=Hydatigena taeniaeformis TaxID=6205 RepID=A0A3P7ET46_HYDTA|nr:unnamed protein product [Hydatigera taeniaeformis]